MHWSTRSMANEVEISDTGVRRIWRAGGFKPHRSEAFKVSNDPHFAESLEAVVGLYLSPPERAIVLCVDEKSQVQALDRTQPGLLLKLGRVEIMTHDLWDDVDVCSDGCGIGQCRQQRHRH
jgi:hypothetical protein